MQLLHTGASFDSDSIRVSSSAKNSLVKNIAVYGPHAATQVEQGQSVLPEAMPYGNTSILGGESDGDRSPACEGP